MPQVALAGRIETAVAHALEVHRAELAELIEAQVQAELDRLVDELVLEALARRNGGRIEAPPANEPQARELDVDVGEPTRRCSTCRRELPASAFGRDARTADGRRRRCGDCRREHEYAARARRGREKASRAARDAPRDDDKAPPVERAAENGRTAPTAPDTGERTPTVDEWLLEAGLAEQNGNGLVATELGLELGGYLDETLVGT